MERKSLYLALSVAAVLVVVSVGLFLVPKPRRTSARKAGFVLGGKQVVSLTSLDCKVTLSQLNLSNIDISIIGSERRVHRAL